MQRPWIPRLVGVACALATLVGAGCSSRSSHVEARNNHLHEYRHGYYNPVDGYFHDDHWHASGPYTEHYRGAYPRKSENVAYWHQGVHPARTISHRYHE